MLAEPPEATTTRHAKSKRRDTPTDLHRYCRLVFLCDSTQSRRTVNVTYSGKCSNTKPVLPKPVCQSAKHGLTPRADCTR